MSFRDDVERLRQELCLGEGPTATILEKACAALGVEEEGTLPARAASCIKLLFEQEETVQNIEPGDGSVEPPSEERSADEGSSKSSGAKRSRASTGAAVDQLREKRTRYSDAAANGGAPAAHDGPSTQALASATPWVATDPWDIQEKDDDLVPEYARESPASNLL
jgi:hypothetical protein